MGIQKTRISSPLEAGPSLNDAKQLPPQLTSALEYVSTRLARKRLHISLIVVRKEIQIPSNLSPLLQPRSASPGYSLASSPARSFFDFALDSPVKPLSRHSSNSSIFTSAASSPTSSTCSSPSLQCATPIPNSYGMSLMHASTLSPKAEKILRQTIAKAEKRFSIGSGWLSSQPLTDAITCPATNDLIRRSLIQNSVLFTSEGLTLLELDHVYTFKRHLHTYSRTLCPTDFTAAVDELRRLVLAQCGRSITKGYLMRAYDWLGVSLASLLDVNEGYKTAYGGEKRTGAIEVQNEERKSPPPLKTCFKIEEVKVMNVSVSSYEKDLTPECSIMETGAKWPDSAPLLAMGEDRGPHRRGPLTPNGFEDVTPITQGEWSFLIVGEGSKWNKPRTVAVTTC